MRNKIRSTVVVVGILCLFMGMNVISALNRTQPNTSTVLNHRYWRCCDDDMLDDYSSSQVDPDVLEELTWSVLRYQHELVVPPAYFGKIKMPKPTPGSIVIPMNMMSPEVCTAAVMVYHDDKMETMKTLDQYDIEHMIFRIPFMMLTMWAYSKSLPVYEPTSFASEMRSLGDRCVRADFVGHCYSQSLFNTAVLRLCGFSAEEVFTLTMPIHAVTIFKVNDHWYIFDSTPAEFARRGLLDSLIFESMDPPKEDIIIWLENDKYFVNFGAGSPTELPYLEQPFSNMDPCLLSTILEDIIPLFNNSHLGYPQWDLADFLSAAIPCPEVTTTAVPYTVADACGETIEQRAESLLNLTKTFMKNQTGGQTLNQYDRSFYGIGDIQVEYPQVYANAAKYASLTSWFASKLDKHTMFLDCLTTAAWIKVNVIDKIPLPDNFIAQSDFLYLRHAGSTIDQAILAYGTFRNMKKNEQLWQPEDLFVIITEELKGFLKVNITGNWVYLNFEKGKLMQSEPPSHQVLVFNESDCFIFE